MPALPRRARPGSATLRKSRTHDLRAVRSQLQESTILNSDRVLITPDLSPAEYRTKQLCSAKAPTGQICTTYPLLEFPFARVQKVFVRLRSMRLFEPLALAAPL